jgi:hypothetical protein
MPGSGWELVVFPAFARRHQHDAQRIGVDLCWGFWWPTTAGNGDIINVSKVTINHPYKLMIFIPPIYGKMKYGLLVYYCFTNRI